jgi:hypothetical protein
MDIMTESRLMVLGGWVVVITPVQGGPLQWNSF